MKLNFFAATPARPARLVHEPTFTAPQVTAAIAAAKRTHQSRLADALGRHMDAAAPPTWTEVPAPPGVSPSVLDAILESLDAINRRQVRMETRLVSLMKDHGLDTQGRPVDM